jgi:hypothetical protein
MTIRICKFNKESKEQFMNSDKSLLGSETKPPSSLNEGDICLLYDFESKEYFGIVKIGLFEKNLTFRENPISEVQGVHGGRYSKYSKYEINIKEFYSFIMNIEKLIKVLGINSKEHNNIVKNSNTRSFTPIYYGSSKITDEIKKIEYKRVIDTFTFIIETTIENVENEAKILKDKIQVLEKEFKESRMFE